MNEVFYTSNGAGSPFDVGTRSRISIIFVCIYRDTSFIIEHLGSKAHII